MTESREVRWLKTQIPRPPGWRNCPKNKQHHISMHVAVRSSNGAPPDVTRFGEQAVQVRDNPPHPCGFNPYLIGQCSERSCRKVYTLDTARITELRPHFLALKAESDRLQGAQRAATMQARKAAEKMQRQARPATKPAKKQAQEDNATSKGKRRDNGWWHMYYLLTAKN